MKKRKPTNKTAGDRSKRFVETDPSKFLSFSTPDVEVDTPETASESVELPEEK
jgi:hypothetical protein